METVSSYNFIDQTQVNIITSPEDISLLGPELKDLEFHILSYEFESQMKTKPMRLNMEKARVASQIIGCKAKSANILSNKIIDFYTSNLEEKLSKFKLDPSKRYHVYTTRDKFIGLLKKFLPEFSMTKEQNVYDFELALEIIDQKKSLIILLGGTSGCGKSTVASLLASRFGIPTVLSTDSIRHVMRNFMSTDEFPVLFASTYEVATKVKIDENISEHKKTVLGFNQQAELIHQRLTPILESYHSRGESIIIEGVHLTPDFMVKMVQKYNNCLPFLIYIKKEDKHKERFAVRSKFMTLDSRANKYVKHFGNIRTISKHLVKRADSHLIPKVDNTNVDKSVGVIHRTIVRCLRRMIIGESVYNLQNNNVLMLFENFNKVSKKLWSKDAVKSYINQKVTRAHKKDKLYREFGEDQNARNPNADIHDIIVKPVEVEADKIEINEVNDGEIDIRVLNLEKTPSKVKATIRKDFLDPDDDDDESHKQRRKSSKVFSTPIIQVNGQKEQPSSDNNTPNTRVEEAVNKSPKFETNKENQEKEEVKQDLLPVPEAPKQRTHLRYSELERLFSTKRVISIKGNPSKFHLRTIKNAIATYNKKNPDSEFFFRIIQTNERYIICKQLRQDASDPNKIDVSLMPNELIRRKKDSMDGRKEKGKMESGTSEFDVDPSEEENISHNEARTSSGSKALRPSAFRNSSDKIGDTDEGDDLSKHSPKKLNTLKSSDRNEASDGLDEDGDDDDHTSIEILESGNSISEQTEEDDEEDEVINHHGYVSRFKPVNNEI